tara:strand:+ start:160 stop:384 length:225 start_codon:yes stop_codon:yes gene_type:complete
MKLTIFLSLIIIFFSTKSFAETKKNCSEFKKFSRQHISCNASKLKKKVVITGSKIKQKTGEILDDSKNIFKKNK